MGALAHARDTLYSAHTIRHPIKHCGSTDVRYGHGFLQVGGSFLLPLHTTYSPVRRHQDPRLVVAQGRAVLAREVVDVVALLVGEAGGGLQEGG